MKLVYVSGPYRSKRGPHYVRRNILRAERVANKLWEIGLVVFCPHMNCAYVEGLLPDDEIIRRELVFVERCDGIVMLPGWHPSEGSNIERDHAIKEGMPVFYWPYDKKLLSDWNRSRVSTLTVKESHMGRYYETTTPAQLRPLPDEIANKAVS